MLAAETAGIITVGTELTSGLRQDTNGGEIARALREAGYLVREMCSVPDEIEPIESALRTCVARCDLVIVTGGLGPTHDDITREAASRALSRPLHVHDTVARNLEHLMHAQARTFAREHMLLQALVLEGAEVIPAVAGSAPGQVIRDAATVVLLPGPPHEMRPLLASFLAGRAAAVPPQRLKCTGISETDAQEIVQAAITGLDVDLTLLAAPGDVEIVLFAQPGKPDQTALAAERVAAALGDVCYSTEGSSLPEVVLTLAREAGERIACAESCTGGMVAAALTDIPGASDVFSGGVVAYANETKTELLGVGKATLSAYGAVSEQTAREMAEGAVRLPGSTLAVATTGVAGPGGGTERAPLGLVWFAVARPTGVVRTMQCSLRGDRTFVRRRATVVALDMLRREILGL